MVLKRWEAIKVLFDYKYEDSRANIIPYLIYFNKLKTKLFF